VSGVTPDPNLANNSIAGLAQVNPQNHPPVLAPIGDFVIDEGSRLIFTNVATDVDSPGQILTFSLSNSPPGAVIDTNTGVFTWTPSETQGARVYFVTVIVADDGSPVMTDSRTFMVTVNEVNCPPVLMPIADQMVVEGATLFVTNSATDPDIPANNLTFSLGTNAPAGMTINATNGLIIWTPTDGVPPLNAVQNFTVVVFETNSPPVLLPFADQVVVEGETLLVTNSATDPDIPANVLTFSLGTNAPGGMSINPTNGLIAWTPTEEQGPSTNVVSVFVIDDGIPPLSASRDFKVIVLETNTSPLLAAISDRIIHAGMTLVISNSASDADIPTNTLSFSFGPGAPLAAIIDPTSGLLTWATSDAEANSTNRIEIVVTDNGVPNLADYKSFEVIVVERPILASTLGTNAIVNLDWTSIPGQRYSLQFSDDLSTSNWIDLAGALTASGSSMQTNDVINVGPHRFYRVKVLP